jgi:hypothetical protein
MSLELVKHHLRKSRSRAKRIFGGRALETLGVEEAEMVEQEGGTGPIGLMKKMTELVELSCSDGSTDTKRQEERCIVQ